MTAGDRSSPVSFRTRAFGFDRTEVLAFVSNLLEEYQAAARQIERLLAELGRGGTKPATDAFQRGEAARLIEHTLESAHQIADQIRTEAEKKAAGLVADAETRAATLVAQAALEAKRETDAGLARLTEIEKDVQLMRERYAASKAKLEATISTLTETLAHLRDAQNRDRSEVA
jgi:cell division septum initiation protein DivIVA